MLTTAKHIFSRSGVITMIVTDSSDLPGIEYVLKDLRRWECLIVTDSAIWCIVVVSQYCSTCTDRPIRMLTMNVR